jgi:hypothetical protein
MAKYVTCGIALTADGTAFVRQVEASRSIIEARRWQEERQPGNTRVAANDRDGAPARPAGSPVGASFSGL